MSVDKAEKLSGKFDSIAQRNKYTRSVKNEKVATRAAGKIIKEQGRLGFGGAMEKFDLVRSLMGK